MENVTPGPPSPLLCAGTRVNARIRRTVEGGHASESSGTSAPQDEAFLTEGQQQKSRGDLTPEPQPGGRGSHFLGPRWFPWASWGLSAVVLGYVASRIHISELRTDLSGIIWWIVTVAILVQIVPRLLEAIRWQYLLRPLRLRFWHVVQAIYVGTLFSGILPLSGGDLVRGLIIARRAEVHVVRVLSTELVERVSDAVAIVLAVSFSLRGLALTLAWRLALATLEVAVGLAILGGVVLVARNMTLRCRLETWGPASKASRLLRTAAIEVVDAAARLTARALAVSLFAALAATIVNMLAFWCLLRAYHIPLGPLDAAAVFAIIMIGTFLPNAPGKVGPWQFFCVVGLQLFGVSATRAAGFSLIAFALCTLPPVLMGLLALLSSPLPWSELRRRQKTPSTSASG